MTMNDLKPWANYLFGKDQAERLFGNGSDAGESEPIAPGGFPNANFILYVEPGDTIVIGLPFALSKSDEERLRAWWHNSHPHIEIMMVPAGSELIGILRQGR